MRIDIHAEDRLGISHDILAFFRRLGCNLVATEMIRFHLYVHFDAGQLDFAVVHDGLMQIGGVKDATTIEWLPTERRQNQLKILLSRLPDPIFDIDHKGVIVVASRSATVICGETAGQLEGNNLQDYIAESLSQVLSAEPKTMEVNILRQPYQADITPVMSHGKVSGAVLVLRSARRLGQQLSALQHGNHPNINDIVGESMALKTIMAKVERFGRLDLPVLITGETGTGKELLARALHHQGHGPDAPFLAINCASLPENLLESELFGYDPGAFSGAQRGGKPGLFELAEGGSVFLDEIGEMSFYLQAKLLRFLQDYSFRRVGGTKELKAKVRVLSATHQDLERLSQQNTFREDLYYRLNVLNLEIPALRDRAEDIPLLVQHFVAKASVQINSPKPQITPAAMALLQSYQWPGNIRQLENLLFRTLALLDGEILDAEHLQLPKESKPRQPTHFNQTDQADQIEDWQAAQQQFEKSLLQQLYPRYPSTRKLAKRLGVSHNKIAMKLKQYGID